MKRVLAIIVGVLLFLAPLWSLWGMMVPVPEYRTGTFADLVPLLRAVAILYGGVAAGIFALSRLEPKLRTGMTGRAIFMAGIAGAMLAILLALAGWAIVQWLTTGRVLKPGQTLALMPLVPILGGLFGAFIAGGAALIANALRRPGS